MWRGLRGPAASLSPPLVGSEQALLYFWILHSDGREQRNPAVSQCLFSTQYVELGAERGGYTSWN